MLSCEILQIIYNFYKRDKSDKMLQMVHLKQNNTNVIYSIKFNKCDI